jgi:hypothetical protein
MTEAIETVAALSADYLGSRVGIVDPSRLVVEKRVRL